MGGEEREGGVMTRWAIKLGKKYVKADERGDSLTGSINMAMLFLTKALASNECYEDEGERVVKVDVVVKEMPTPR